MEIRLEEHTIAELIDGYIDSAENGVVGYGGKLNIRPAFQREFVYKEKERNAVIDTVMKGFPLNVMYWVEDEKGNYELLDGQQRTLSICQYCSGDFSVMIDGKPRAFHNLTAYERQKILDYRLMIYICKGNDKEKLDWFQTINIAGMVLTAQELRNAVYTGPWLSDAKRYFSKTGCAAYKLANKYLNGEMNRQAYLEKAIKWAADKEKMSIDEYMAEYQNATDATALWMYFTSVINWVKILFPVYRKEMKGLEWGILYNRYHTNSYYPMKMEMTISILMADREVTKKSGVYEYMLSEDEKHLSIRKFDEQDRRQKYEQQQGICPICRKYFDYTKMHADHITPWHAGGKTVYENLQMLCRDCNLKKSGQE